MNNRRWQATATLAAALLLAGGVVLVLLVSRHRGQLVGDSVRQRAGPPQDLGPGAASVSARGGAAPVERRPTPLRRASPERTGGVTPPRSLAGSKRAVSQAVRGRRQTAAERRTFEKHPVRLTATMPWSPAAPGERSEIRLDLEIARGWHINCHQPRQEFLIPTAVRLGAGLPVELGEISYPEGRDIELAGEQVRVYDGKLTLLVPLAVRPSARAGTYHLALTLRFQACDSSACLAPQELTVQIPVRIAAGRR